MLFTATLEFMALTNTSEQRFWCGALSNSIVNSRKVLQLASTAAPPQDGASNQQPMETDQTCVMIQKLIKHDPKTDTPPSLPHISYSAVHATSESCNFDATLDGLSMTDQTCNFDATSMQLRCNSRCNFDETSISLSISAFAL